MLVQTLRMGKDRLGSNVRAALMAWDRFLFLPRKSHAVSLMRLLAGIMALYSTFVWGLELDAFIGEAGWNNAGVVRGFQAGGYMLSFWWYVPAEWQYAVHCLSLAIVLCFAVGLFTRITSILSWVIVLSYANRAMFANFGLDQVICMLLMYLMLAPCGENYSLDALIRGRRGSVPKVRLSTMSTLATRLIQLHMCVIYLFAGLSKLQGESWWNGNAVWNAISNYEYQSFDLTFLANWPLFTDFVTQLTVFWEISFIALVWNTRLRPIVLLLGFGMHIGIGAFLGMWTFGLAMIFCYLSFIQPALVESLV